MNWGQFPLFLFIIGYVMIIVVSIPLHEVVHEYNCEYFGGTVTETGFAYIRCDDRNIFRLGMEHYSRYKMMDALNELVTYNILLLNTVVVNVLLFIYLVWGGAKNGDN